LLEFSNVSLNDVSTVRYCTLMKLEVSRDIVLWTSIISLCRCTV